MIKFITNALVTLGLSRSKAAAVEMTPEAFTEHFAARIRDAAVDVGVEIVGRFELRLAREAKEAQRVYLDNTYQLFLTSDPSERPALLDRYVASYLEAFDESPLDQAQVVPVVKGKDWLKEVRAMFESEGKQYDGIYEALNDDLVVFYVQDTPSNIRYITSADFDELGIERQRLRRLAVGNLRQILPGIDVHRGDLVSMVAAGGSYEASLVLFEDFWERERQKLKGEPVIAIPCRDLLLFADSGNQNGVARLRELAAKAASENAYAVSDQLFIWKTGALQRFESGAD